MFSDFITTYLFLGGAGAGTCALLACLNIACLRTSPAVRSFPQVKSVVLRRFYGFGFIFVALICALGALCLLFDMARPDKVIQLILLFVVPQILLCGANLATVGFDLAILWGFLALFFTLAAASFRKKRA